MYIFLDESGKPEVFSSKGTDLVSAGTATKFLVLAAVKTSDHLDIQQNVSAFKSTLLQDPDIAKELSAAYALDAFHANHDKEVIRRAFYQHISTIPKIEIHVIVAEKLRCKKALKTNPIAMYGLLSGLVLQGISHQEANAEIIFSRQDNGKLVKQQLELEVERIRKYYWAQHRKPPSGLELAYQHNPHYSHAGLQIADYVAFAVFKYFENGNSTYLKIIQDKIRHIHHFNNDEHFTRSRPLKLS